MQQTVGIQISDTRKRETSTKTVWSKMEFVFRHFLTIFWTVRSKYSFSLFDQPGLKLNYSLPCRSLRAADPTRRPSLHSFIRPMGINPFKPTFNLGSVGSTNATSNGANPNQPHLVNKSGPHYLTILYLQYIKLLSKYEKKNFECCFKKFILFLL